MAKKSREERRKEKQALIMRYNGLKDEINKAYRQKDIKLKHEAFYLIDREFKFLCPKKYKAYEPIGDFKDDYYSKHYWCYLKSRCKKMLNDIDRILFYFDT